MSLGKFPDFLLNFSGREMSRQTHHYYHFKSFRLEVEDRRLLHDGVPVQLEPKVFDLLALLVENSGHLVEKDELLRIVWADSFVEETNVARAVYTLRKTLGKDENGNKFIETVAKKGYRFVAEVTEIREPTAPKPNGRQSAATVGSQNGKDEQLPPAFRQPPTEISPPVVKPKQKTRIILFAVGLLSAAALLLWLSFNFRSDSAFNSNKPKSIAVLPVQPINTTNRDEIYEAGIAESLIHRLGSTKGFVVRPLSGTRKYADVNQDPLAAGREQRVDYVLASNYQLVNGKIKVTAQLFNVANGQIEETYKIEKEAGDLFKMQDEIAGEMGNKLLARFAIASSGSPKAVRGTTNEEAYRLYLQGKNLTARQNSADARKATEYFEQAVRLDPNFANAYSGMTRAYIVSGSGGGLPRAENEKAKEAVKKALELDGNLAEAYAVRGHLKMESDWDFAGAEKDLLRAIELEPNNDVAHWVYAILLAHRGRSDEALAEIDTALAINPHPLGYQGERGRILYYARRYDEAIVQLKRVVEVDEDSWAWGFLWLAYEMKGDEPEAYEAFMKRQKISHPERVEVYQKAYETAGWQAVRRQFLEFQKLEEQKPGSNLFAIARNCALLGEKEQAFEYLNKAFEKRQRQMMMLNVEPALDSLRDDPRFDELVRRVGLK